MQRQFRGRTRGSVRFAPYWKLQWWDAQSLAWRDIQRSFPTPLAARDFSLTLAQPGKDIACRLIMVTQQDRTPQPLEG